MMDENSAGCASEGVVERIARARDIAGGCADRVRHLGLRDEAHRLDAVVELCRRALSHAVSQDVPALAAVTAEMVREARRAWIEAMKTKHVDLDAIMAAHLSTALSAATPLQSDPAIIYDETHPDYDHGLAHPHVLRELVDGVQAALDRVGAPTTENEQWLTLTERIEALAARAALQGADNHE